MIYNFQSQIFVLSITFILITIKPMNKIIAMIISLICLGIYSVMLNQTFIGQSFMIVYIGAIAILFLFVIMMVDLRIDQYDNQLSERILIFILYLVLLAIGIGYNSYLNPLDALKTYEIIHYIIFDTFFFNIITLIHDIPNLSIQAEILYNTEPFTLYQIAQILLIILLIIFAMFKR